MERTFSMSAVVFSGNSTVAAVIEVRRCRIVSSPAGVWYV
jgi:hypothetical protein